MLQGEQQTTRHAIHSTPHCKPLSPCRERRVRGPPCNPEHDVGRMAACHQRKTLQAATTQARQQCVWAGGGHNL